jgi:hypothetical protein
MRDSKRIRKFCNRLATAWELLPDWRFGQMMMNILGYMASEGKDPFFTEDEGMLTYIEQYIEKYTGVAIK